MMRYNVFKLIKDYKYLCLWAGIMFLTSIKIWMMDFPITQTNISDIILGMAAAKNIDIKSLIMWYAIYAIPMSIVMAYLLHRNGIYKKIWGKWKNISCKWDEKDAFIGFVILEHIIMGSRNWVSIFMVCSLLIAWWYLRRRKIKFDKVDGITAWLSLIISFYIPITYLGQYLQTEVCLVVFCLAAIIYVCKNIYKEGWINEIYARIYPFIIAGIFSSLLLAGLEIVLLRGKNAADWLLLIPYLLAVIYSVTTQKHSAKNFDNKMLIGCTVLLLFTYLPALGQTGYIDFFEGANHGLSIQEAINGTGVPILNNLDAHLLSATIAGGLYYYLTGDYTGALFAPYNDLICMSLGIFSIGYLLRRFFSAKETFILLVMFPWAKIAVYFCGFIVYIAFVWWKKQHDFWRSTLVWSAFTIICVYRIDMGASFGAALVVCPLVYCFLKKNYKDLVVYAVAGSVWIGVMITFAWQFAVSSGIEPLGRMVEFLTAFSSNQHWALGNLGSFFRAYWFYFLLPTFFAAFMITVVKHIIDKNERKNEWIIFFLYLTFLFNIPRMTVRHTLFEQTAAPYAVPLILIALILMMAWKYQRTSMFTAMFLLFSLMIVPGHKDKVLETNIVNSIKLIQAVHAQEHTLYKINNVDAKQIAEHTKFFTEKLHAGETYFDFSNQSLFFAFTKKNNPIYINQCPGMINGNKGQLQALVHLKEMKPRFVVMPYKHRINEKNGEISPYGGLSEIDGLLNLDRYYHITEYITDNYRPYCTMGNFALWCLKSEYDALCEEDKLNNIQCEYIDYTYEQQDNHLHELGYIPYLWGNCTFEGEIIDFVIETEKGKYEIADNVAVMGDSGFIGLQIESDHDGEAKVIMKGDGIENITYKFAIKEGKHLYRLRVSNDLLWFSHRIEELIVNGEDANVLNVYFEKILASELE